MFFHFYFLILRLPYVLPVNVYPLLYQTANLANIHFFAALKNENINKVSTLAIKVIFLGENFIFFTTKLYRASIIQIKTYTRVKNFHLNSFGKNCVCYSYLLKVSSYLFKRKQKVFSLKMMLITRAEALFTSLFVRAAKKSILARLTVW